MTEEEFPPFEEDDTIIDPHWKDDHAQRPMAWLKVVDLSTGAAGPFCAKLLADFGADVVKVEDTRRPDWARTYRYSPDRAVDPEKGALFLYENTNKRGLSVDLGTPEGRQILLDLLADADVLVEDWTYAEIAAAGPRLRDAACEVNPRLVVTSVTPYGRTGPFRDYHAHPLNTFHSSGQGYLAPDELAGQVSRAGQGRRAWSGSTTPAWRRPSPRSPRCSGAETAAPVSTSTCRSSTP